MKVFIVIRVAAAVLLATLSSARGIAATAEDFGFGNLTVNGTPVAGRIPLLIAIFELSTNGGPRQSLIANAPAVFDPLFFNFFALPSINGYFLENSYGTFSWERAGIIGPVIFDANETSIIDAHRSNDGDGVIRTGLDSGAGIAYALGQIAAKTGYDFAQWDANGDGTIQQEELSIVIIGNNGQRSAANRPIGAAGAGLAIPGQNVTVRGKVASVDHRASFMSIAHELSHSLGTVDLYANNCRSSGLSLMSCTIFAADDDRRSYHLDPWHKMRFGWLRPRIFSLTAGGVATAAASQINSPNTPVILYDPARGTSEYFMVEYRNNQIAGADHDIHICDSSGPTPITGATNGMAVWHVAAGNPPAYHEGAPALALGNSTLWIGQMTPVLSWSDGSPTPMRLNPIAIVSDGRELLFEWIAVSETWVDFAYVGFENGSFFNPFNTIAEGANAASHGGILKIRSGATAEQVNLSKRLTLEAVGGPVTIGQ
jgi:M6 family metalloprotease-like protein